jgi:hypothetical protein
VVEVELELLVVIAVDDEVVLELGPGALEDEYRKNAATAMIRIRTTAAMVTGAETPCLVRIRAAKPPFYISVVFGLI